MPWNAGVVTVMIRQVPRPRRRGRTLEDSGRLAYLSREVARQELPGRETRGLPLSWGFSQLQRNTLGQSLRMSPTLAARTGRMRPNGLLLFAAPFRTRRPVAGMCEPDVRLPPREHWVDLRIKARCTYGHARRSQVRVHARVYDICKGALEGTSEGTCKGAEGSGEGFGRRA